MTAVVNRTNIYGDFRAHGLCVHADPTVFDANDEVTAEPAKAICRRCPVQAECLEHALLHDERFGVWGATTSSERQLLRQQRGLPNRADQQRAEKQATAPSNARERPQQGRNRTISAALRRHPQQLS